MNDSTDRSQELDEYHKIEVQKVFDAIMWMGTLRLQLGVLFLTGNVTLLGFAANSQKVAIVALGAVLFLMFAVVDFSVRGTQLAFYYRAKQLQRQFAPKDQDSFVTLPLRQSANLEQHLDAIAALPNEKERTRALQTLPLKAPTFINKLMILMCISEIAAAVLLYIFLGWKLI